MSAGDPKCRHGDGRHGRGRSAEYDDRFRICVVAGDVAMIAIASGTAQVLYGSRHHGPGRRV